MSFHIGGQVAGYRIVGVLGQGGMGVVYEAEHVLLGRKAALKTLLSELSDNVEFRQRFIFESQVVASIDHPNIIPIYDAGEVDGTAYIAMRFVPGDDLGVTIQKHGPLALDAALSTLDQAGAALDAAHARGLVHRDVKPANILLEDTTGRIYLTDFGIVKEQGRSGQTQAGYFLGTIDYAAPEQIEGKELTPAADVYAFGCVLFEALTGHKPFEAPTDMAVIRAHVLEPPPKVTAIAPHLPAGLDDVIERALAKEAGERFESCRAVIEASRLAVAQRPVVAVDAVAAAPVAVAAPRRTTITNLPLLETMLVGRDQELQEVADLLADGDVRLVTLTGFGGTGKTRLSLAAADAAKDRFDRVVFVDLSPVTDDQLVPATIAQELGAEIGSSSPLEAITAKIGASEVLLVVDNFEHVVDAASFLSELIAAVPTVKLLVTSQTPLRIRSEREFAVPPLGVPDVDTSDLAALAASPAVALFVDRARHVRPGFELNEENAAAVADICRALDGIPLAIELAAARVKLLTPQALRGRLQYRLDILTGGGSDMPERQRTLRSAIDWSFGLLNETDQAMLTRLSVFNGGCSLEAAEAVAGAGSDLDLGGVVDVLASLVDKSLLRQTEAHDGEPRFSMLETIREYAMSRLEERGEAEVVRQRHAEWFLTLVEAAEPELTRANQAAWLAQLDEETGNIRAGQTWALESGHFEVGLRYAGALVRFWSIRGLMAEGSGRLAQALLSADSSPVPVRTKAEFAAGYAALGLGEFADAERHFTRSLELAADDVSAAAAARAQLAWIAMTRTSDGGGPALELATQSLAAAREIDDKRTASGALNTLAELALQRGESEEALRMMEESLALRRGLGDQRLVANSLLGIARARLARGEYANARPLLQEGLSLARELGDTWSASVALAGLGRLRLLEDAPEEAAELFKDALRLAAARRDKRAAADCLHGLGSAVALQGDGELASRLLGAADAARDAIGASLTPAERTVDDHVRPKLRAQLGDDFDYKLAAGRGMTLDDAIALVLPAARRRETQFQTA